MRKPGLTSIALQFICVFSLYGQINTPVAHLISGDKVLIENVQQFVSDPAISDDEILNGYYYRYIQFYEIPTLADQVRLKNSGLQIVEYIPDNIYLVAIPRQYATAQLLSFEVRSVVRLDVEDKMDQRLREESWPDWAAGPGGGIKVMIKSFPGTDKETFVQKLAASGVRIDKDRVRFPFVFTLLLPDEFIRIASLPFVQFLDIGPDPGEPEDTGGRTLQRANLINSQIAGGLKYDGSGVSVQVRDDGVVGPHIDFEGRLFDMTGGSNNGTHGDGVAGVFAGAGNLEPEVAGSASGADIYVTNYESTFTDNTIALHQNQNVVITNSSYSNGCNAGYTSTTQTVDQQMVDNPHLMHVFSAGNSNNNECGYGAGTQWGNITGGHKQGKNVIAVANLFADGTLVGSSSRGPAYDGRIKPDISAHGQNERSTSTDNTYQTFGGTSAAAPTMAGSYAQLYQVYRTMNGGANPSTGLLKAVVLNSAFDLGNKGPDFKYGWGRIDAYEGYKILESQSYLSGSVSQGAFNNHAITIPTGIAEARIMVYWVDPAASISANKALVNNLNSFVTSPSAVRHDPWILDATPDPVRLDLPATRGIDNLNNMEQISIEAPAPGQYVLRVDGAGVPIGTQEYFVVWTFLKDEIKVTYPNGGEGLVPGETQRIHWDAFGNVGTFQLQYSTNDGASWTTISSAVNGGTRLFNWTVPNVVSGKALIRISRSGKSDVSDDNFSILSTPNNLTFTNQCKTGTRFQWNAVAGANNYNVYRLGSKYMELISSTASLFYDFNDLPTGETVWLTVQATNNQGAVGRKADAISIFMNPALPNCRNTVLIEKTASTSVTNAGDTIEYSISFTSFYDVPITNVAITDILDPTWKYIDLSLTCGTIDNHTISINHGTVNPDQTVNCSFKVRSDILSSTDEIFFDNLESGTGNWTVDNLRGPVTWALTTTLSNSPIHSWYTMDTGNGVNTQAIQSTPISLGASPELSFFHSYSTESGWDGGFVEISVDNGFTFQDIGHLMTQNGYNGGLGNGANPDIANRSAFTGSSGGFIETKIDLSAYANGIVVFRFLFGEDATIGGNGWYIDDVRIQSIYNQINSVCVSYDQGIGECATASTVMIPCSFNCDSCTDGVQNGDEAAVDCGGSLCAPCPCTQMPQNLVYINEVIPDGTNERLKFSVTSMGGVITGSGSTVNLRAGNQVLFNGGFTTGEGSVFSVIIEDCEEN